MTGLLCGLCKDIWVIPDSETQVWHAQNGRPYELGFLPEYCAKQQLQLLAFFDQHNGLTPQLREQMPFSMVEHLLPSRWEFGLVMVSASANNSYYLKVSNMEEAVEVKYWFVSTDDVII